MRKCILYHSPPGSVQLTIRERTIKARLFIIWVGQGPSIGSALIGDLLRGIPHFPLCWLGCCLFSTSTGHLYLNYHGTRRCGLPNIFVKQPPRHCCRWRRSAADRGVLRDWSGLSIFEIFKFSRESRFQIDGWCIEIWRTMNLKIVHAVIIILSMGQNSQPCWQPIFFMPCRPKARWLRVVLSPGRI